MSNIVTVAQRKGGVGKTTVAMELAYVLDAVLVDLEWDGGSASRRWGYRSKDRVNDLLWTAIEKGRVPRPLKGHNKPDLVPGSSQLVDLGLSADDVADAIAGWSADWGERWAVIDTHPGSHSVTHGAIAAAHCVLLPTPLAEPELDGAEDMIEEMADYPLVIVPTMVPRVPPRGALNRLRGIVEGTPVQVAPPIPVCTALRSRKRRMAMSSQDPTPKAYQPIVAAFAELSEMVKDYVR